MYVCARAQRTWQNDTSAHSMSLGHLPKTSNTEKCVQQVECPSESARQRFLGDTPQLEVRLPWPLVLLCETSSHPCSALWYSPLCPSGFPDCPFFSQLQSPFWVACAFLSRHLVFLITEPRNCRRAWRAVLQYTILYLYVWPSLSLDTASQVQLLQ